MKDRGEVVFSFEQLNPIARRCVLARLAIYGFRIAGSHPPASLLREQRDAEAAWSGQVEMAINQPVWFVGVNEKEARESSLQIPELVANQIIEQYGPAAASAQVGH